MSDTIVLITGAGRKGNIGWETARQLGEKGWKIIISGRDEEKTEKALQELKNLGIESDWIKMDLTDDTSVEKAAKDVQKKYGRLDVLVNDAGLMKAGDTLENQDLNELREVFNTNVIGTWSVTQKFLPLLKKSSHPRIVNVSSGAGSYEDSRYGLKHGTIVQRAMGYGISKLAENGLTVKMAKEFKEFGILVNSVCPDTTDSYGMGFGRPVEESARSVIWACTLPDDGPTGGFFRDGKAIEW